jgi:hypothetical protein
MFLDRLALAGAAGLLGARPNYAAAAEAPLETRRIRFGKAPSACLAPQYVAEELLRAEGFQQIDFDASRLASGVYFYRLVGQSIDEETGMHGDSFTKIKKMMLVK